MYVGEDAEIDNSLTVIRGATLLIIVINGYMASSIGLTPQLTQNIILTQPGGTGSINYIFTRHASFVDDSWLFYINTSDNIVLGSVYIADANIGMVNESGDARINIGTYPNSKVNINNAFIGDTINRESNAKSVVISTSVNIGSNVTIRSGVNIAGSVNIASSVNIDDAVNIGVYTYIGESVNIGKSVNIGNYIEISNNLTIGTKCGIVFESNQIKFIAGDKTATLQLS